MKPIHRMILQSNAYRMSSRVHESTKEALAKDPSNDLFWRFNMRRLSAEEIRDNVLATTGRLNRSLHGPSIYPKLADEVKAGQSVPGKGWQESSSREASKRSIYIHIKRSLIPPELSNFDFPETDTSCEARFLTTQPAQALECSTDSSCKSKPSNGRRLLEKHNGSQEQKWKRAIEVAWGRSATSKDLEAMKELHQRLKTKTPT